MESTQTVLEETHDYKNLDISEYKNFFEEMPVALIRTDLKTGKFLMANKYAVHLFGYDTIEQMTDMESINQFYSSDDRKKMISQLKKVGIIQNYEIKLTIQNKTVWASARLRINCEGQCIEGSLIDITEVINLRDKQLNNMKELGLKLDRKIAALAS